MTELPPRNRRANQPGVARTRLTARSTQKEVEDASYAALKFAGSLPGYNTKR